MGLDVTFYSTLTLVKPTEGDITGEVFEEASEHEWAVVFDEGFHRLGSLVPGFYEGEADHSYYGSYSRYNRFRSWLCQAVHGIRPEAIWENPEPWEGKPFYELINFADNEGWLGPEVCAKLNRDFQEHKEALFDAPGSHEFRNDLSQWIAGFEAAANGGAAAFH